MKTRIVGLVTVCLLVGGWASIDHTHNKERLELAHILGQIVGILNTVPEVPTDKLESLMDAVSAFTLKGVKE